jgi:hypothetical protein
MNCLLRNKSALDVGLCPVKGNKVKYILMDQYHLQFI